jgi:hypothetical protein
MGCEEKEKQAPEITEQPSIRLHVLAQLAAAMEAIRATQDSISLLYGRLPEVIAMSVTTAQEIEEANRHVTYAYKRLYGQFTAISQESLR